MEFFQNLDVSLPKEKDSLKIIVPSAKRNFEKCLHYILIPDNNAAYLKLRILTENFVILKFLLNNDSIYSEKWFKWSSLDLPNGLRETEYGRTVVAFETKLRKEYEAIEGNKPEFEQLIKSHYGWTFPVIKSHINFERIADYCNEKDMYDKFVMFSAQVHSNSAM